MNKKFINALLFSAALLSTGMMSSCKDYDDDINSLNDRVTAIETTIADIQAKIGEGYFIKSCNYSNGVLTLELSNGQTYTIKDGAKGDTGAAGTPGAAGKNGTIWQINGTTKNWEYKNDGDANWTDTGINAQGLPGTPGAQGVHAESPYIGEDGNWVIWKWDAEQNKFVEEPTTITASGTTSYVVDKGLYYELHMVLGTIDTEGNFTATDKDFSEIRLPKTHALTNLKAYTVNSGKLEAPVVSVKYATIGNKDVTFNNTTYAKNTVQVSENSKLTVKVNPTEADVKLYNFSLIDSKGNSIFSINSKNIVANTSESPLTRTATINNGFYDMPLVVNAGLEAEDITSTTGVAYALATANYNDDQITTDYEINIKAEASQKVAEKSSWNDITLTKTAEKSTWTFAEVWEMIKDENTDTPDVMDYYFVLPENQTAAADGYLTIDQSTRTITVLKNSATPIKLYVNYITLNGTAVESNAEGEAVNDNKQAKEIEVNLESSSETTIGDVNWTIQADDASTTTNDETKVTVEVIGLDQFWPAAGNTESINPTLKFANDKIIVDGKEISNPSVQGITLTKRTETDNKGYKRYYLDVDFDETKVYAEPVIATLTLTNGTETKEVSFNINVTSPENGYFEFQKVDAYFNEEGQASVYDVEGHWNSAENIIRFNLSQLFKNVNSSDPNFEFEEVVPELKAGNATAWLQPTKENVRDGLYIGQYKLEENKNGVKVNTGIGSTRTFKVYYRPFGNANLSKVVEEIQFTGRSVVNEGKFYWGTATGAGKAIEVANSAQKVEFKASGFYGIEHGASSAYVFTKSNKISKYVITGDENAQTYFDITSSGISGTPDNTDKTFSINRKTNANVEKQVSCVFTVTLTDRCGMPKVATVTVTLLPNE